MRNEQKLEIAEEEEQGFLNEEIMATRLLPSYQAEDLQFVSFLDLTVEEVDLVFQWRNHEEIRKWMFDSNPLKIETHRGYVKKLRGQYSKFYWMVKEKGKAIGVISLFRDQLRGWEWGFYLNPAYFFSGYSIHLMHHALKFFFTNFSFRALTGYVNCFNLNSILLHHLFGIQHKSYLLLGEEGEQKWYTCRQITRVDWLNQKMTIPKMKRKLITDKLAIQQYREAIVKEQQFILEGGHP